MGIPRTAPRHTVHYAPEIAVRHYARRGENLRLVQYQDYARSHGGFYGKYLRKGDWYIALRAMCFINCAPGGDGSGVE
jgi:hypothetical protein